MRFVPVKSAYERLVGNRAALINSLRALLRWCDPVRGMREALGQVLHRCARNTHAVRAGDIADQASITELSRTTVSTPR